MSVSADYPCPKCGATVGEQCRTLKRGVPTDPHTARLEAPFTHLRHIQLPRRP